MEGFWGGLSSGRRTCPALGQVCGAIEGLDGGGAGLGGRISLVEFCGGGAVQFFGGPKDVILKAIHISSILQLFILVFNVSG